MDTKAELANKKARLFQCIEQVKSLNYEITKLTEAIEIAEAVHADPIRSMQAEIEALTAEVEQLKEQKKKRRSELELREEILADAVKKSNIPMPPQPKRVTPTIGEPLYPRVIWGDTNHPTFNPALLELLRSFTNR